MLCDTEKTDRLAALMLINFACADMLYQKVTERIALNKDRFNFQTKGIINNILFHAKGMKVGLDRMSEIGVDCGRSIDGENVVDAYLYDRSNFLRLFMMTENAIYGPNGKEKQLKLESVLKQLSDCPVFDQNYIDSLTDFK